MKADKDRADQCHEIPPHRPSLNNLYAETDPFLEVPSHSPTLHWIYLMCDCWHAG